MSAPVLRMEAVTRVHGNGAQQVTALHEASLNIHAGEFVAVMGPSGSGKSTLLHLAGGLDAPTSGNVFVDGVELGGLNANARAVLRRRGVGYVFQDFNLLPGLTTAENVAFPLELDGWSTRRARIAAMEALEEVDLLSLADRRPEEISGGQAQRVAVARALIGPRRLLLADEPTGALDSVAGTAILQLLQERADHGAAVLLVTHDWTDRTVFLRDGRIIDESGPSDPNELLIEVQS